MSRMHDSLGDFQRRVQDLAARTTQLASEGPSSSHLKLLSEGPREQPLKARGLVLSRLRQAALALEG